MTTSSRRRPRRSNSLTDLQRLLGVAGTTYEESRVVRLEVHSAKLNNTEANAINNCFKIATVNLFLRRYGVQLIVLDSDRNERRKSRRWGTREGIESLKDFAEIIEFSAAEVDATAVDSLGFTTLDFDAHSG